MYNVKISCVLLGAEDFLGMIMKGTVYTSSIQTFCSVADLWPLFPWFRGAMRLADSWRLWLWAATFLLPVSASVMSRDKPGIQVAFVSSLQMLFVVFIFKKNY